MTRTAMSVRSEELIIPPMTTAASSAPIMPPSVLTSTASGNGAMLVVNAVIRIGRSRVRPPTLRAYSTLNPPSRSCSMKAITTIAFVTSTPGANVVASIAACTARPRACVSSDVMEPLMLAERLPSERLMLTRTSSNVTAATSPKLPWPRVPDATMVRSLSTLSMSSGRPRTTTALQLQTVSTSLAPRTLWMARHRRSCGRGGQRRMFRVGSIVPRESMGNRTGRSAAACKPKELTGLPPVR